MFGGEYRAPAAEAHLNQVLAQLAKADDTPGKAYRVTILNTPTVNAFALPTGNLYVTRGLLALANDTSEVAAVMAHEIAHVTARHASQREEAAKTADLRRRVAGVVQSRERGEEVQAIEKLSLASFSRRQELEADQIGVKMIARAGYDPYGAARFLEALGKSTAMRAALLGQKSADETDIMASHPSTPERVNRAIAAAREISGPGIGNAAREPYLEAINGIDFGDDPAEGIVRGRRFIHGRLGFSFLAPDGFTLENTAQAVLGVANKGNEALRLDSVRVPGETSLETYMATGWIEGLDRELDPRDQRQRIAGRRRHCIERGLEIPHRRGASWRRGLQAHLCKPLAQRGNGSPLHGVHQFLPPHSRAGGDVASSAEARRGGRPRRRHHAIAGRAHGDSRTGAGCFHADQRPAARRTAGARRALQVRCGMISSRRWRASP